jgi:hypothetical protein
VIDEVLTKYGKHNKRVRLLPSGFLVYFILALALWREPSQEEVLRIVCDCLKLIFPDYARPTLPTKSAIFKARLMLGPDVLREVANRVLRPKANPNTPGAWYNGLRLMSLDCGSFAVPDSKDNANFFGYPGAHRDEGDFPQLRQLGLFETASHVPVAAEVGPCSRSGQKLAALMIDNGAFSPEMLIIADKNFYGYGLWKKAAETGAKLLWRVKSNLILPVEKRFPDNSFLSTVCDSRNSPDSMPIKVRVIDFKIKAKNHPNGDKIYRTITNMLDYKSSPAKELAALYHERREIRSFFEELKIGLKGSSAIIRSKVPDLVLQDIWGLIIIHFTERQLMAEAAWECGKVPDKSNPISAVHVIRSKLPHVTSFPHSGEKEDD